MNIEKQHAKIGQSTIHSETKAHNKEGTEPKARATQTTRQGAQRIYNNTDNFNKYDEDHKHRKERNYITNNTEQPLQNNKQLVKTQQQNTKALNIKRRTTQATT